jgi:cellulose synthase/poly-beta-1,6-N-acetylglucosamine synthase-like glycosyltransferase
MNASTTKNDTPPYVLLTAAYNEEEHIEETMRSVVAQTVRPAIWVIVSDGSTDRTDVIIRQYMADCDFIRFVRREKDGSRGFASKVFALRDGLQMLELGESRFIGHLDGDVSFDRFYFSSLLAKFSEDPGLGIAGGGIAEKIGGKFRQRRENRVESVPGAVQMFRYECYRDVGELLPIEYGGEDWYAEVKARMCGWRVRSFPELEVRHHRATGRRGSTLLHSYRQGFADFALGSHPIFEVCKLMGRIPSRPYLLGAAARLAGYCVAHVSSERMVSREFVAFLQKEQMHKVVSVLLGPALLHLKRAGLWR